MSTIDTKLPEFTLVFCELLLIKCTMGFIASALQKYQQTVVCLQRLVSASRSKEQSRMELDDSQVFHIVQHLYNDMKDEEEEKRLDPDELEQFKRLNIKPLYPHKYTTEDGVRKLEKYECGEICCELSPGSTCCACFCDTRPPDRVYREFGLGANIYFTFIKHFSYCFLLLAVLSALSLTMCYFVSVSNDIAPTSNYQVFFFSGTMGSLSANFFKCKYDLKDASTPRVYEFTLSCPVGSIYKYGPVLSSASEESIQNCKTEREKYETQLSGYYVPSSDYSQVSDSSCSSTVCKYTVTFNSEPSTSLVSYPYACDDPSFYVFGKHIEKRVLTYIMVGLDLLVTVGLLFFLCSEKEGEDEQIDYFKSMQVNLSDFAVKLKGFTHETFDDEFESLVRTFETRIADFDDKIVQVKIPDDQNYIEVQERRKEQYQNLFEFIEVNFFDDEVDPNRIRTAEEFKETVFPSPEAYESFKAELCQLLSRFQESRRKAELSDHQISIYLTLLSSGDRRAVRRLRQKTCCGSELIHTDRNAYELDEAPVPDMLQWQNKSKWTCCRLVLSWTVTLCIVAASYLLFGLIQYEQNKLLAEYDFDIDCALFYTDAQLATYEAALNAANSTQYTHCYCYTNYLGLNVSDEVQGRCSEWWGSYLTYLLIPLLISLGIVVYNLLVSFVFRLLSTFEGHFLVTDELFSYTVKRSFILVMNMGLIIVLLNFNYSGDLSLDSLGFLFQGQYSDLTSDWYIEIGSIVVMTMIFNIFFPFLELAMHSVFKCLRKCLDKRCWTRSTSQKYKRDYIRLYSGDVYPIEERYALIISIFWITLLFNCVIPLLNLVAALSFALLELVDRVLVFKFFKTPINYDESLHQRVLKALYLALILHMVSTAFLLSEPNLLADDSSYETFSSVGSDNQRLDRILKTYYIIPYVVLLALMVAYALLKTTLCNLFEACCNKRMNLTSKYKENVSQDFFKSLSEYQLGRLKLMTEKEITRVMNQRNRRHSAQQRLRSEDTEMDLLPGIVQPKVLSNSQLDILTYTHSQIEDHLQFYKQRQIEKRARLIGMPGYDTSLNESEFEKERRILQLDSKIAMVAAKTNPL